MPRLIVCVRLLDDALFSAYVALLVVTEELCKPSSLFLGSLGQPLEWLYRFVAYLSHRPAFRPGLYLHTVALWWFLALIVLVCIGALGRIRLARTLLRCSAGFVAIVGFPFICLALPQDPGGRSFAEAFAEAHGLRTPSWLWLEVILVVAFVLFYVLRKGMVSSTLGVLIIAAHFSFWGWVTSRGLTIESWWTYLLLGICTVSVWGLDYRLAVAGRPSKQPPVT